MNSLTINSEINRIKSIGLNRNLDYISRRNAVDQLTRFPHKDKNKHITECILSVMSDNRYPIEQRYQLFSENRSLDNEIQRKCHLFYFNNFNPPRYPIRLKLLSAQYILQNKDHIDIRDVYGYLYNLGRTSTDPTIKAECADILSRAGYTSDTQQIMDELAVPVIINEYRETRRRVEPRIENLPDTRRRILVKRRTVYDDGQNVHNNSINENVKSIIRTLYEEHKESISSSNRTANLNEVSMRVSALSKSLNIVSKQKIRGTFDRLMIDTSKFENDTNLCDILILVWQKIKSSSDKPELEKRLIEELEEMNGLCATGHLSRLINTMSGFFDNMSIKISYKDQIKTYVFNHYNKILSCMDETKADVIIEEMTDAKKENLLKMIEEYSIKEKLRMEFNEVSSTDFEEWYLFSINSYSGIF